MLPPILLKVRMSSISLTLSGSSAYFFMRPPRNQCEKCVRQRRGNVALASTENKLWYLAASKSSLVLALWSLKVPPSVPHKLCMCMGMCLSFLISLNSGILVGRPSSQTSRCKIREHWPANSEVQFKLASTWVSFCTAPITNIASIFLFSCCY